MESPAVASGPSIFSALEFLQGDPSNSFEGVREVCYFLADFFAVVFFTVAFFVPQEHFFAAAFLVVFFAAAFFTTFFAMNWPP
jgi:hypothetical protein